MTFYSQINVFLVTFYFFGGVFSNIDKEEIKKSLISHFYFFLIFDNLGQAGSVNHIIKKVWPYCKKIRKVQN